jgi:ubiquitin-protein ligase
VRSRYRDGHSRRSTGSHGLCAGGIFKLELFLPEEYPMAPPKVRFTTKLCALRFKGYRAGC